MHIAQIDRVAACDVLTHQPPLLLQTGNAVQRPFLVHDHVIVAQQHAHRVQQLLHRDERVAVVQVEGQRIQNARVHALIAQQRQSKLHRQTVRQLEIHIIVWVTQQIRVLAQRVDGAVVQALVQQRRERDRQTVFAQKVHQQAHFALFGELTADLLRLAVGNAAQLRQTLRLVHKNVKRVLTELFRNFCRQPRTDSANQARTEVLCDAAHRGRQPALKRLGRKLLAVGRVRHPAAGQNDLLTQSNVGKRAGRRDLGSVFRSKAQHGIAVFVVVVNDLLHRAAHDQIFSFVQRPTVPTCHSR